MRLKEQSQFFHQLAVSLEAGIPLSRCVTLAGQGLPPASQRRWQSIETAVLAGKPLAAALKTVPKGFDRWTVSLVQMAEYSGALPQLCERLAIAATQQHQQQQYYRSIGITLSIILWSSVMGSWALLQGSAIVLTQPLFWIFGIASLTLLITVAGFWATSTQQQAIVQHLFRWLAPLIPWFSQITVAQRVLAITNLVLPLSCGVPLLTALDLLRRHLRDPILANSLNHAIQQVRAGQSFSQSIAQHLPVEAASMLQTGEQTGDLAVMLDKLSQYYAETEKRLLKQLQSILIPTSLMAVGALIALLGIWGILSLIDLV